MRHAQTVIFSLMSSGEKKPLQKLPLTRQSHIATFASLIEALSNPAGRSTGSARLFLEVGGGLGLLFDVLLHAPQFARGSFDARLQ